nr:MAG TPA: lytic transglycosylase [Caudoviricetes sp.]
MDITSATASGADPEVGVTIGVDPAVIPYGTIVLINGKEYIAQDTGNYTGNRIDILCESEAAAVQLGTYETKIYVKWSESRYE